ncbi:MAG: metal ABC transporter substrate-binding protein [Acidimicrobiaceae bacterium]|nr:metal ABC transporter substrate-binding protein [Acidimicrobiaceae bacterium]
MVLALVAAGCGDSSDSADSTPDAEANPPVVLATTGIWADVVANLACDGIADVEAIIPVGGDPHGFEPSLQDRERMENADLVVANGLQLETRLLDTLEAVKNSGTPVFAVAEHVESIPFSSGHDDHDDEGHEEHDEDGHDEDGHEDHGEDDGHDHAHGSDDPHVWFDPVRVAAVLGELAQHLIDDAGLDADSIATCRSDYQAELEALDHELEDLIERLPTEKRKLVTNHDALGYFADRYGFEIIGTALPSFSTLAETNPAQLEELAQAIEHEGVNAIFGETVHSSDDIEALAARIGEVEVVTLHTGSLGPPDSGAEDYIGFMRTNARLIVDALS